MEYKRFTILGQPVGKTRHRSMVLNGKIHNYNTKANKNYEDLVRYEYQRQLKWTYFDKEVEVVIEAYYGIPKSWSKKKQEEALRGEILPIVKPDLDNISKIILDSLNRIAYKDDSQVTRLHCYKHYSNTPRVEVMLRGETLK